MTNSYNNTMAAMPMPARIRLLPISDNGYPTPWFAATVPSTGKRDLRVADASKRALAAKRGLCWVCGQPLGTYKCFVIGPMCVVNRTTSEPPCHYECARFSALACPFLTKPRMRRNDVELPVEAVSAPGENIMRNPGVTCLWVTKTFKTFRLSKLHDDWLIKIGEPCTVEWFAEGQTATRAQVAQSVDSGFPLLMAMARKDGPDAVVEIEQRRVAALALYPAEAA